MSFVPSSYSFRRKPADVHLFITINGTAFELLRPTPAPDPKVERENLRWSERVLLHDVADDRVIECAAGPGGLACSCSGDKIAWFEYLIGATCNHLAGLRQARLLGRVPPVRLDSRPVFTDVSDSQVARTLSGETP